MIPVPNNKQKLTTLRVMRSQSKNSRHHHREQWMVIKGDVEVISKTDKTTPWMDSTEYVIRLSEGAEVETSSVNFRVKIQCRRYCLKNGTLHYKIV
jgi:hypothetical protein